MRRDRKYEAVAKVTPPINKELVIASSSGPDEATELGPVVPIRGVCDSGLVGATLGAGVGTGAGAGLLGAGEAGVGAGVGLG